MKCIYPDMITSISASEEDASYPAANLLNDHPKKVWKGTSRDAVLTAIVSSGGALAIFATNATSITVAISSGQTYVLDTGFQLDTDYALDSTGSSDTSETSLLPGDITGCLWSNFTVARTSSFTATITLTAAAGQIIQAGCVKCGTLRSFRDPEYGIKEGLEDKSIQKELNNGAFYYRKRDVLSTFDFTITPARDPDFWTFMRTISKNLGPAPIAWRLMSDSLTDEEWITFARFNGRMPQGSHDLPAYSPINVSLVEVL